MVSIGLGSAKAAAQSSAALSNAKTKKRKAVGKKKRRAEGHDAPALAIAAALPRIRDFRGISSKAFDGRGNYSLGISDQTIFPEIELDKVNRTQGMDITIVTSAKTDKEALDLLTMFGMPFAGKNDN